jgi:NADPH:quinone reductase-like Zn-dependent oxidoreductase
MKGLILDAEAKTAHIQDVPQPQPGPGEVLVQVKAVALNPVDATYVALPLGKSGRTVGSDFCGVVVQTTSSGALQKGQRVAGFLQGACSVNDRPGSFAEYLVILEDLVWRVPDSISDEEAAAINLCGLTAAQAVFHRLKLPAPFGWGDHAPASYTLPGDSSRDIWFLVYGATTSVGMYAAQYVRRSAEASGRTIRLIGAASKGHWDMLRAEPYGYAGLVDYKDPNWVEEVRKITGGEGVDFAYDSISEGSTVKMVSHTLRTGGKMAIVRSKASGFWETEGLAEGVEPIYGAVWEGLGVEIQYVKFAVPASPDARAFAVAWYKWLSEGGKLQANPLRHMPGGLEQIVSDGFVLLGAGSLNDRKHDRTEPWMKRISAEKMVYKL